MNAARLSHGVLAAEEVWRLASVGPVASGPALSGAGLLTASVDLAGHQFSPAASTRPCLDRKVLPPQPLEQCSGILIPNGRREIEQPQAPSVRGKVALPEDSIDPVSAPRPSPKSTEKMLVRLCIAPIKHASGPVEAALRVSPACPYEIDVAPLPVSHKPADLSAWLCESEKQPVLPVCDLVAALDSAVTRRLLPLHSFPPVNAATDRSTADTGSDLLEIARPLPLPRAALEPDSFANAASRRSKGLLSGGKFLTRALDPATRFWKIAPADLKWITLALPIVLALTLMPTLSRPWKASSPSNSKSSGTSVIGDFLESNFSSVHHSITQRAAINWSDDFRSGLSSWEGVDNWAKTWAYDEAGFIRPGNLAVARPTVHMSDYTVEFLGQIETKALSWVFRAADLDNYYAIKIAITKPGPLPTVSIVRQAVVNGRAEKIAELPIPMSGLRNDTVYRVRMDVAGNSFSTYVQGQLVDTFTDDRLKSGGVGFYSSAGERYRLRWVGVTYQYDFLGRLCALLAPYSVESDTGSWK